MSGPPIDITPDPPELFLDITPLAPGLVFGLEPFVVVDNPINPEDFATAAQGATADSAVQPSDLGTAASAAVEDFATAAQGATADSAVQPSDLGTAASAAVEDFATAAQGATADSAVQPGDLGTAALADVEDFPTAGDITAAVNAVIGAAPGALDTLDELAAALADDPSFASTITTALAGKQPLDSGLSDIAALTMDSFGLGLLTKTASTEVRSYLGLVLGTDVQTYHVNLAGLAGVTSAADRIAYFTGVGGATALTTLTSFARTLLDDSTASEAQATLNVPASPLRLTGYGSSGYAYFIPGARSIGAPSVGGSIAQNRNRYELWEFDEDCDIIPAIEWNVAAAAGKGVRLWACLVNTAWQPQSVFHDFGFIATDAGANAVGEWGHKVMPRDRYCMIFVTDGAATFKTVAAHSAGFSIAGPGEATNTLTQPAAGGYGSGSTAATNLTAFTVAVNGGGQPHYIKARKI